MAVVEYKQGMTKIWSDGEKLTITNPVGRAHIKTNLDALFGLGVYEKLREVAYLEVCPQNRNYELVTGFIPKKVKQDLKVKEILEKTEKVK